MIVVVMAITILLPLLVAEYWEVTVLLAGVIVIIEVLSRL